MNSFRNWYLSNATEITWFLIGWLTMAGLDALGRGNYVSAAVDFGLVFVNYKLNR